MMASAALIEELTCSVCLNIYTNPATLTCGHSFCQNCIGHVLDSQEGSGVYECPECRRKFEERPELVKNRKLCNIVDTVQFTKLEVSKVGIYCTYCIHTPVSAAKTCLLCEASLCDDHVKVHNKAAEHVLAGPTTSFSGRKCSLHKKILEYYCMEDTACICVSCRLDGEHQGHQVETLNEASDKSKEKMRNILETMAVKRAKIEKKVQDLHHYKRTLQDNILDLSKQVSAVIGDIRNGLDTLEARILNDIFNQEEEILLRVANLSQKLEIKDEELSKQMGHIEELCKMTDPITVLQGQESISSDQYDAVEHNYEDSEGHNKMVDTVGQLDVSLVLATLRSGLTDLVTGVQKQHRIPVASVASVKGKRASDILLDVKTAGNNAKVSLDLKLVSWSDTKQNHERLQDYSPVLSSRSFSSGRHYWEVETSEADGWNIGMACSSINTHGATPLIGYNKKSWYLCSWLDHYLVKHNGEGLQLPVIPSSQRFRIYLDYELGQLSFYELSDPIKHLHTFSTIFTEPLHVALVVGKDTWFLGFTLYFIVRRFLKKNMYVLCKTITAELRIIPVSSLCNLISILLCA
uniref:Uncharacterized protein n=1 Tax=Leptobrachium leishanense TaxID=445787 RepID=A0A8C5MD75_9ANUR